jgi:CDP-diacylglycerol--glycerol-3-phosphate 3-phosphatidyltransferase
MPIDRSCGRVIIVGLAAVLVWHARASATPLSLMLSLTSWLVVSTTLWRGRRFVNPSSPQATRLGAATHLTLLRGLLISLVAGFAAIAPVGPVRWLPALLYGTAAICDRFDGVVARRLGQTTPLGARLDEAMDALGLLAAPVVAVAWGRLPPWYLLVGAAYYLFHAGLWLRRRLELPVHLDKVLPKRSTRIFAGLQMALVSVALAPLLSLEVTTVAATMLMMPTLVFFGRDWLIATGRLEAPPRPSPAAVLR